MEYFTTPKNQKNDDLEVTGISRSGRVRKKSSKLLDFESPDDITEHKLKKQRAQQHLHAQQLLEKYEQSQRVKSQNINAQGNSFPQQNNVSYPTNNFQRNNLLLSAQEIKEEVSQEESSSEDEEESSESESDQNQNQNQNQNGLENDDESSEESTSDDDEVDPLLPDEVEEEEEEEEEEMEVTGFTKLEPPEQVDVPSQAKNSLYMLEKYKKKLVIKDGKVINKPTKTQRKDKGKTRFTAYMLWSKDARQQLVDHHPNLDFASISRKLGELWATVPNSEKMNWRKRAKRLALKAPLANKDDRMHPGRTFINKMGSRDITSPKKTIQLGNPVVGNRVPVSPPSNKVGKDLSNDINYGMGMYKVTGTQPIDIAAHLTLLGESLTIIGKRLKEHEGQITVSGSLPLLLDSLLCALGPLLCLTQQIPEMNGADPEDLSSILENVAYIMPGL